MVSSVDVRRSTGTGTGAAVCLEAAARSPVPVGGATGTAATVDDGVDDLGTDDDDGMATVMTMPPLETETLATVVT